MEQSKKDQKIGDVDFGEHLEFAFEMFKVIARAVMEKGGNMQRLRRILEEPALQRQIVDLLVPVGSEVERPLEDGEYRVPVRYEMPCDKAALEAEFSKNGVSDLFYGNYEWRPHSSCAQIDQTPGERIMLVKHFGRDTTSEENIAEMDRLGYRPATDLEAYAFAKANPELQRQFSIVALGSFAIYGTYRCVAVLGNDSDGRYLRVCWFSFRWDRGSRFLFVRKQTLGPSVP